MSEPALPVETREGELHRLHPLSPLLRGWRLVLAILAAAFPQYDQYVIPGRQAEAPDLRIAGLIALGLVILVVVYCYLAWRFTRYGIHEGDLRVDSGILFRRSRRVRLDRLQAIDVVRPFLGRVLGLAELRLEVAGGSKEAEAPLAYLSLDHAVRLRAELLARAAGLAEDTPEAPERVLHEVPLGRLVAGSLLSTPVLVGVVLVPVAVIVAALTAGIGVLVLFVPILLSVVTPPVRQLIAHYGFTLAESPDGFRVRRGLLETRAQTVPPGRIQAVRLREPWLWRRFPGWAAVEVDIAGYALERHVESSALLLPVAPRELAEALVGHLLPGVQDKVVPLTGVPRRAIWLAPLTRRVLAAGATDHYFVTRSGLLQRRTDTMPHERIQSVRLTQGPVQRWLRLATVALDTTPGPVTVRAEHRDAAEAAHIVEEQAARARLARGRALPPQWMRRSEAAPSGSTPPGAASSPTRPA